MDTREKRELALRERFLRGAERWSRNTRDLKPLMIGQKVLIQNQHGAGKIAKKWDRTGQVVEDLGYNKYRVRVDGSGRVSDRNRQFLRQITPVTPSLPGPGPTPAPSCHDTAQCPVPAPVQTQPRALSLPTQAAAPAPVNIEQQREAALMPPPSDPEPGHAYSEPELREQAPEPGHAHSEPELRELPPEPGHAHSGPELRELPSEQPSGTSPVPLRRSKRSNFGKPRDRLNL